MAKYDVSPRELQGKTGLSLYVCKKALDSSGNDYNSAITWLRENNFIRKIQMDDILGKCSEYAGDWAKDFLEMALESGELKTYYESGELDIIIENYFHYYVIGIPGVCPHLIFADDMKYATDEEEDLFNDKIEEFYTDAVGKMLPDYIQPDWTSA